MIAFEAAYHGFLEGGSRYAKSDPQTNSFRGRIFEEGKQSRRSAEPKDQRCTRRAREKTGSPRKPRPPVTPQLNYRPKHNPVQQTHRRFLSAFAGRPTAPICSRGQLSQTILCAATRPGIRRVFYSPENRSHPANILYATDDHQRVKCGVRRLHRNSTAQYCKYTEVLKPHCLIVVSTALRKP
jgi:hypothetical protein